MTDYYCNSSGAVPGSGTLGDPWGDFASINWSLVNGNILNVTGTFNELMTVPNTVTTATTYLVGSSAIIDGQDTRNKCMWLNGCLNVEVNGTWTLRNATADCLSCDAGATGVVRDMICHGSGNQGFQMEAGALDFIFYNITSYDNVDDGFSSHSGTSVIYGGNFYDNSEGIAVAGSGSNVTAYDITFSGNTTQDIVAVVVGTSLTIDGFTVTANATQSRIAICHDGADLTLKGGLLDLTLLSGSEVVKTNNGALASQAGKDIDIDGCTMFGYAVANGIHILRGTPEYTTGSTINVNNNTFVGGGTETTWAMRVQAVTSFEFQNNICDNLLYGVNAGAGGFTNTTDYNCFNNVTTAYNGVTPGGNDLALDTDPLFTASGSDDYTLTSGSPCVGAGTKWWGDNPRPAGADGEPYPDTFIDIGGYQSTWNVNHPANL